MPAGTGLTGWVPELGGPDRGTGRGDGAAGGGDVGVLIVLNLLVYAVARDPGITGLLVVAACSASRSCHMMLFRRTWQ